jgi:excisionase family DNA binding protein
MAEERITASMDDLMTTPQAAEYLGVTAPHVRLLLYNKILRGEKRGRDLWVTVESLEEYRKNRRPAGRPEGTVSSGPSKNKRGEHEREYQREYKRRLRKGQRKEQGEGEIPIEAGKKKRGSRKG